MEKINAEIFAEAMDKFYKRGYEKGYEEGFNKGLKETGSEGFENLEKVKIKNLSKAEKQAYYRGFDEGYDKGLEVRGNEGEIKWPSVYKNGLLQIAYISGYALGIEAAQQTNK